MSQKNLKINFEKLLELAQERGEVKLLESNLFNLYQLNRTDYHLRRLFHNRRLSNQEKMNILEKLFGFSASSLFYALISLLLEKQLDHKIYYIYEGYTKVVQEKLNIIIVQAFTAVPINLHLFQTLKPELERILDRNIILKNFVNPDLLGGIYLKLPNGKIYDFTYQKELENLKFYLLEKAHGIRL